MTAAAVRYEIRGHEGLVNRLQQRSQSSNEYELFCGSSESASIGQATIS